MSFSPLPSPPLSPSLSSSPSSSSSRSSLSSSLPPEMEDKGDPRNWAELPPDLTASILLRLGAVEILNSAQRVCTAWRRVCKEPSMWRKIDMHNLGDLGAMEYDLEVMCRHAVDRSQGGLEDINIEYFGTDSLLAYIADRSSNLKRLRIAWCYGIISEEAFIEAAPKLPLLEDIEFAYTEVSEDALKALGSSCPNLKTFKLNCRGDKSPGSEYDEHALAIAESMPELRHLQLVGNGLTDTGLNAILEKCSHLEHLDLRQCFHVNLVGDLEKRCSERIKVVRRINDPTNDCAFDTTIDGMDPSYLIADYYFDNDHDYGFDFGYGYDYDYDYDYADDW